MSPHEPGLREALMATEISGQSPDEILLVGVVPSTWNAGPRDGAGQMGPYEASLVGNPIADPERPLEVLRTIHSFDPCLACAIHTHDPEGNEVSKVRVL
jgi:hydrogenase large subunit